ncbi:MAG: chloramphenicol phosphotransferase [Proteobacteria bacterium]|nr:chloramphenicol phosphotransferase [Pseudomonadota bacterium]
MAGSRIILLNGVGSVGKTSTARALQEIASLPLLHVQMDTFLDMLPERLQEHADGFSYEALSVSGTTETSITAGPVGVKLLRGMRRAIAAMADAGNNLIVDDVLLGDAYGDYVELLARHDLFVVGLHAALDVLERRERERGDRSIGLARWQFSRVHAGIGYDLEIDTDQNDPRACAALIKAGLDL